MNKNFIPYNLALELKELGFNKECFAYYVNKSILHFGDAYNSIGDVIINKKYVENVCQSDDSCLAPLWQQAFDWFRDKHKLHISFDSDYGDVFWVKITEWNHPRIIDRIELTIFDDPKTLHTAMKVGLKHLIKITNKYGKDKKIS